VDITEIADRLELDQLMVRYVDAIDAKDWDLLDTCFTPDAHLDYSSSGGEDGKGDYATIKAWLQTNLAMFPMTQHLIGKSAVTIDGDRAECRTIFHNPMGVPVNDDGVYDAEGSGLHVFVVGGWYLDTCVRTPDGWRIEKKVEEQAFMDGGFPPFG
jgi:hypothetical protein